MRKKLLFVAATVAMALSCGAEQFKVGVYTFNVTDETTVEVSKADSKNENGDKILEYDVPATVQSGGVTYSVKAIGKEAFKWSYATKIVLPQSIESFEADAFNGSSSLEEINFPERLSYIGDYAFSSTALKSVVLPSSVKKIGSSAFFTCKSLSSVIFNEGLEEIGNSAFYKTSLTNVVLPQSLTEIGAKAFLNCEKLETVTLPNKIKVLPLGLFYGCKLLKSLDIAEGVTEIGDECFLLCESLKSISIPSTVEKIGTGFIAKTSVSSITLAAANSNFVLVDGILYDTNKKLLYAVPMKGVSSVNVDSKCIGINGGAFWGSEVAKVVLPNGFLAIDDYAFCQSALAEINFPASITYIGEQGFAATKLKSVVLPENMPNILDGAFAGCEELTTVTIPSAVKRIYNHAFHNDVNLTSVTCLGSTPPEILDVYETYDDPFFGVPTTTTLYVPKGTEAAYRADGWHNYFKITESDFGVLACVGMTPADGAVLGANAEMKIEIEFSEDINVVKKNPEVFLRKDSELSGAIIEPDDAWVATVSKNTLRLWASDYDGYTMSFTPEQDREYYLVIPAGVVQNSAGDMNERIVVKWVGPSAPKELAVVSTTPENGAVLNAGYADMSFRITFEDEITILDYAPDAELREGDSDTGLTIDPDLSWKALKENDGKTLHIWASDYDGYIQAFKVKSGTKYYMTIPAGIVKNDAGDKNGEIRIEISGSDTTGIDSAVSGESATEVARYDLNGHPVAAGYKGICVVRMSDGTVRKVYVK